MDTLLNTQSILLAESHYLVREGLQAIISPLPGYKIIDEVYEENSLFEKIDAKHPEIVIIDYNQAGFGPSTISKLIEQSPSTQVLVITSDHNRDTIFEVISTGIKAFIFKSCDRNEIVNAIQSISRNEKFFCSQVIDILLERSTDSPEVGCDPIQLTEREVEIVSLMAEGLSSQNIADKLCLSVHTIYTHRKNIMRKLKVTSAAEVIRYAFQLNMPKS